jgi:DNA adenine methylase
MSVPTIRAPFAYYGGKTNIADRIAALLPAHQHYVEPFAGSLAVLFAKSPSKMETANDLNGDLMLFWRVLRDRPTELLRACALTPHSRAELDVAQVLEGCDELEHARRVWVRLSQARTGTLRKTGWRFFIDPNGSSVGMPAYLSGYVDRIAAVAERLHRVSLEARPALDLIEAYGAHPDVLLYCDPPYLAETRSGSNYANEMAGTPEHRELAEALRGCAAAVVVSGYDSPLYDEIYAGWDRTEIRTGNGQGGTYRGTIEVLWSNRAFNVQRDLFAEDVAS